MKEQIREVNRVEMTFDNNPENERIGRVMASAFAAALNPTMEELSDFKTAVSEAVTIAGEQVSIACATAMPLCAFALSGL